MSSPDSTTSTTSKQPWNYEAFVRCYNEIADEYGGWHFRGIPDAEYLKKDYEESDWKTIRSLAMAIFQLDQQY